MTMLPEEAAVPGSDPGRNSDRNSDLDARVASLDARVASLDQQLASLRAELEAVKSSNVANAPRLSAASRPVARASFPPPPSQPEPRAANEVMVSMLRESGATDAPRRSESLEDRLGAQVLSKVAVVLLLIGAAWFLKWAFDNRWIGPAGRIFTGLVAGIGVVLWSERFRQQKLAAFSYALKAVGSGVLYLSLWASFQVYHLVPAGVAFGAMVCVTVWNAVMAWAQDAPVLAGYALLGAYLTPVLVSSGGDHEVFLFSYLWVIAASLLVLVRLKRWHLLLLAALPVTAIFFIAWYVQWFDATKAGLTAILAVALWAIFAAVPLVADAAESVIAAVIIPLGAATFGALSLYSVLVDSGNRDWEPWCAVGFAAIYLTLSRIGRALAGAVHLSLGIVFLTIAVPLKATGRGITLGWLVEAVALLWIATVANIDNRAQNALRWLGWAALLLGVGGALIEPWVLASSNTPFLNREFATSLAAVAALAACIVLSTRMADTGERLGPRTIAAGAMVLLNVVLLAAMHREIFLAFEAGAQGASWEYANFCFSGWMMLQGAGLLVLGFWRRIALARWLGLILLGATVVKAFVYDMRELGTGYRVVSYLGLGVLLMAVSFAYQKDWLGLREVPEQREDEA